MPYRGVACTVTYTAWDTNANAPKTGDGANHSMRWNKAGTDAAASGSVTEVSNGEYKITLNTTETDAHNGTLHGSSSTSGVIIIPVRMEFSQTGDNYAVVTNATYGLSAVYTSLLTHGTYGLAAIRTVIDSLPSALTIASAVWASAGRTLTSYGTLVSDIWAASTAATASSFTTLSNKFAGITVLGNWLRAALRKDTPDATALSEINSGGGGFLSSTDSTEAIRDRGDVAWITGSSGGEAGEGSEDVRITIKDTGGDAIADADVWVRTTTDDEDPVVASGVTDNFGQVTFNLDPGTYYRWAQKSGVNFTNPQSFTVTDEA